MYPAISPDRILRVEIKKELSNYCNLYQQHERNEVKIDNFTPDNAMSEYKSHEIITIMRDLNNKVGIISNRN